MEERFDKACLNVTLVIEVYFSPNNSKIMNNTILTNISSLISKKALNLYALFILTVLILCGSYFRALENNELDTLDMRFCLRPAIPVSDKVVIIEIGDDTIKQLGRFPFDRSYHAFLIKALSKYGARAVMFDIFFSEPDKSDAVFKEAIKQAQNVYLPYVFEMDYKHKQPVPEAEGYNAESLEDLTSAANGTGHINVIPDPDGKYRRAPVFIKYHGVVKPSLSFVLIRDYLGILPEDIHFMPGKAIQCGANIKIPLDDTSGVIVNYAGAWGQYYKHYSYVDVLQSFIAQESNGSPNLDLNVLRGKICLIGLTATGTTDLHPNAFAPLYPSIAIHADIINSILNNNFITRAPRVVNLTALLTLFGLMGWIVFKSKPLKGLLWLVIFIAGYSLLCLFLFIRWGLWLDMFYPVIVLILTYLLFVIGMYIGEFRKRLLLENELQLARSIQESFLPKTLPNTAGLEVAAVMRSARYVGGDLYDFYEFSAETLAVVVGDVTGKGVPASLFMSKVSGAFKFFALADKPPAEALLDLNAKLTREASTATFVTIFYAIFEAGRKIMKFASGGHPPVLYLAKGKASSFLDVEDGLPLGMVESLYSGNQLGYSNGDIFVFYTDGVTEARNRLGRMYGQDRLVSVVEANRGRSCQGILNAIENDVRIFEPKSRQHDDLTLIVIKAV